MVCVRGAASVAVVHGIAYPGSAVRELRIRHVRLVCLVVRIELMMGREGSRGRRGRGHGAGEARREVRTALGTLLLPQMRGEHAGEAGKRGP